MDMAHSSVFIHKSQAAWTVAWWTEPGELLCGGSPDTNLLRYGRGSVDTWLSLLPAKGSAVHSSARPSMGEGDRDTYRVAFRNQSQAEYMRRKF